MHSMIADPQTETPAAELLPWHKPLIERLLVSLDTRIGDGSGPDGLDGTDILQEPA